MISLWLTRHLALDIWIADSWHAPREIDSYDTLVDVGIIFTWTL